MCSVKGCLAIAAVVILVALGLRAAGALLGFVGAILALVPAPIWIIGAVVVLVWAIRD